MIPCREERAEIHRERALIERLPAMAFRQRCPGSGSTYWPRLPSPQASGSQRIADRQHIELRRSSPSQSRDGGRIAWAAEFRDSRPWAPRSCSTGCTPLPSLRKAVCT